MLNDEIDKKRKKKNIANSDEPFKPRLIFPTWNPLYSRSGLNQEAQHLTNLILKDKIVNKKSI